MEIRRAEASDVWDLRQRVLRPGQPIGRAMWPGDEGAFHWALLESGQRLAVLSIFPSTEGPAPWQLRGMAVEPSRQGQGLGGRLLRAVEQAMFHEYPGQNLWCNARLSAVNFYAAAGWQILSEPFEIEGVGPHRRMLRLSAARP